MEWNLVVILISVVLLALLVWKEVRRGNRARLALRIIASVIAVAALACMAVTILIPSTVTRRSSATGLLVTEGFSPDSLTRYKNLPAFTLQADLAKAHPRQLTFVPDLAKFLETSPLNNFHILGNGLNPDELAALDQRTFTYFAPLLPAGIRTVHWNHRIRSGEPLDITGKYGNPSSKAVKLVLEGVGTALDSATIAAGSTLNFHLQTNPANTGTVVYSIHALAGNDTLVTEKVPVEIAPRDTLKILMLAASPGFEHKFLKNWLYEHGYSLAVRTTISKNKYSTEYLNTAKVALQPLTPALLSGFSLVIADQEELDALPTTSATTLRNQVNQGLGLLVRGDSIPKATIGSFRTYAAPAEIQKFVSVMLPSGKAVRLETEHPYFVSRQPGDQPLVTDPKDHILANSRIYGKGKVLLTTLTGTYAWALSGNQDAYGSFWSLLIGKTARKQEHAAVHLDPLFAEVNEKTVISWAKTDNESVIADGIGLLPTADPLFLFQANARYWPTKTGWKILNQGNSSPEWAYFYPKGSWKTQKSVEKIKNNQLFSINQQINLLSEPKTSEKTSTPVQKWYFFLLFVACCGFLWLETKLL